MTCYDKMERFLIAFLTSPHASPFTLHSDKNLSPCSLIAFLNPPHPSPFTLHLSDPSPEFLNSLRLLRNSSLSHKGRGNCFGVNHSPVQLFNLSTLLTLHSSHLTFRLPPHPNPLPQGERRLFYVTNPSTFQPFTHSTPFTLHPSPFTLHASLFTLLPASGAKWF